MNNRKIDELVVEKVFGLTGLKLTNEHLPNFSTDIKDAWQIVDKFKKADMRLVKYHDGSHSAEFRYYDGDGDVMLQFVASASTAPMAICLAALKSVGIVIKEAK